MRFVRLPLGLLSLIVVVAICNLHFALAGSSSQKVELLSGLGNHKGPVHALAFSPNSSLLASAGVDQNVIIWDTSMWRSVRRIEGNSGALHALAFNADGSVLAAGAVDGTVQLWNTALWSDPKVISAHDSDVRVVSFSNNGKFLVTAGRDNKLQPKSRFGRAGNFFSLDKTDDIVKVWNTTQWSLSHILPKATSRVVALSFTPSGQLLASGEEDGGIAVMNTKTWRTIKRLKFQHGSLKTIAFDASGTRLIGSRIPARLD